MKRTLIISLLSAIVGSSPLFAQNQNTEVWVGKGTRYNSDKENPQPYALKVEIQTLAKGQKLSKVTVDIGKGSPMNLECKPWTRWWVLL